MTEPSYSSVLHALCRSITSNEELRVQGKHEGYRCKATYSLLPSLQVSLLSMPEVNRIAAAVGVFCTTRSRLPRVVPDFFAEVCVKVNRTGQYMVKLSCLNRRLVVATDGPGAQQQQDAEVVDQATVESLWPVSETSLEKSSAAVNSLFSWWQKSPEPAELEAHLRSTNPALAALVAHVRLPSDGNTADGVGDTLLHRKPDKSSAYVPLTADGASAIVEYTPNGHSFWLSADSFCEVNHAMEDAIYETIVAFLRLQPTPASGVSVAETATAIARTTATDSSLHQSSAHYCTCAAPLKGRRAFICGRDVNSVVRTFEAFYDETVAVTSCPCVFADTQRNGIQPCVRCDKDQIATPLRTFASPASGEAKMDTGERAERGESGAEGLLSTPTSLVEAHALITAGRHGLHPSTTTTLADLATAGKLSDLIYVSCNVDSLTRDVHVLKESWYIAHARTFDFFPGTEYVMTVLHLRPVAMARTGAHSGGGGGGGGGGDLLVLPVGMPGVGKSTCGRALGKFFSAARTSEQGNSTTKAASRKKARKEAMGTTGAARCSIPRTFLSLPHDAVHYRHVERDQLFSDLRTQRSLKQTKQSTHDALLAALGTWDLDLPTNATITGAAAFAVRYRRVLYLDSTNGSREGRELYAAAWAASSLRRLSDLPVSRSAAAGPSLASCVVLRFAAPASEAELLRRVQHRGPHPSFPATSEDQQRKLEVIASALAAAAEEGESDGVEETPVRPCQGDTTTTADPAVVHWCVRSSSRVDGAADTVAEVVLTVCAHLLFSSELAMILRNDALTVLLAGEKAAATTRAPRVCENGPEPQDC